MNIRPSLDSNVAATHVAGSVIPEGVGASPCPSIPSPADGGHGRDPDQAGREAAA